MEIQVVKDLLYIYGLSVVVLFVSHHLRVPTIVGFLIAGVIAGPHGLALVPTAKEVEILADWGVVLLLFIVGMEFSPRSMMALRTPMLVGGGIQVLSTTVLFMAIALAAGLSWNGALLLGLMASLSSTAIILKLLQERGEIDSPTGRISLAVLIFQDVTAVAMLMVVPWMGGTSIGNAAGVALAVAKGAVFVLCLLAAGRWLIPQLLRAVASTRRREIFLIAVAAVLLAVAWFSLWAGLSLALGAFLAGLILAESPYAHQVVGSFMPMRDLFLSLFFVAIGMLLDPQFLWWNPHWVAAGVLAVVGVKWISGTLATRLLRYPLGICTAVGLTLGQVGEFSFLLARAGIKEGLMDPQIYNLSMVVIVLTMASSPLLMAVGRRSALMGGRWPGLDERMKETQPGVPFPGKVDNHLIIVGFGVIGQTVAQAAKACGIPYVVVEMNPRTVETQRAEGVPILYGDAVNEEILKVVGIQRARVLAVTIADPVATRHIVATAKSTSPAVHIIARTRYVSEMDLLFKLGANEVVAEEYETAMEIFARTLRNFLVPQDEIQGMLARIRSEGYEMLRHLASPWDVPAGELPRYLPDINIVTVRVDGGSQAEGKTLEELALRRDHGVTVLAIARQAKVISNPPAQTALKGGDMVVLMAPQERICEAQGLFLCPSRQ